MRQEDRLGMILERLSRQSSVGVPELAAELGVSPSSVRRDLQLLETQQLLTRTHGGAVASGVLYELPMRYRGGQRQPAKQSIARAAAALIGPDVVSVGLNGGSTTTEVARALAGRRGLRVVTNAVNIAAELAVRADIDLVVSGGRARSESYELVGPVAEATLADVNLDVAVLGVDGISTNRGITTHDDLEARVNRALLAGAERVIVVADATKVGRRAFAGIARLDEVHDLVTDAGADEPELLAIADAGVTVHTV